MRLMAYLLQSLQAFCAHLILILIHVDHSMLLASNLINVVPPRALLLPVHSKLFHYFFSHLAAIGFWGSLLSNNITLNPGIKRTD